MATKVREGAKVTGMAVAKGTGTLIEKAKEASSPEAQERRLEAQEKRLQVQERMAQRRARIAKLQPRRTGGIAGFQGLNMGNVLTGGEGTAPSGGQGFGLKPMDMSNVLTGEPQPRRKKGKPFDPFSQI